MMGAAVQAVRFAIAVCLACQWEAGHAVGGELWKLKPEMAWRNRGRQRDLGSHRSCRTLFESLQQS